MSPSPSWGRKARQFRAHLAARVTAAERETLAAWLRPEELEVFDRMHVADRRHGLDVVTHLRHSGVTDRDVLVAGLLHDCAKGDTGVWPRVAWSLGEAFGPGVHAVAARIPGWRAPMDRLHDHADASARILEAIGLPARAVALVREQHAPTDPEYGRRFHAADEAC
jgi:HD domain